MMLSSDDACVTLDKLPEDVLSRVGNALVDDLCGGATALTQLRTSHTLQRLFGGSGIQAVAMERGICGPTSLEGLAVLESVVGLGTNRIFFREAEAVFRAGSSRLRLEEFAAMLRRHPTLMALVEAHAGSTPTKRWRTTARESARLRSAAAPAAGKTRTGTRRRHNASHTDCAFATGARVCNSCWVDRGIGILSRGGFLLFGRRHNLAALQAVALRVRRLLPCT